MSASDISHYLKCPGSRGVLELTRQSLRQATGVSWLTQQRAWEIIRKRIISGYRRGDFSALCDFCSWNQFAAELTTWTRGVRRTVVTRNLKKPSKDSNAARFKLSQVTRNDACVRRGHCRSGARRNSQDCRIENSIHEQNILSLGRILLESEFALSVTLHLSQRQTHENQCV